MSESLTAWGQRLDRSEVEFTSSELVAFNTILISRLGEVPNPADCDVCVCGGREFNDYSFMAYVLGYATNRLLIKWFLTGGAPGADRMALEWAARHRYATRSLNARWKTQGRAAGPIRNAELADELVRIGNVVVIAMPGDRGTADMIMQCTMRGLFVIDVQEIIDAIEQQRR